MNKPGNNNHPDDNLQGHNAELINAKFADILSDNPEGTDAKPDSDSIVPNTQKKDSQE